MVAPINPPPVLAAPAAAAQATVPSAPPFYLDGHFLLAFLTPLFLLLNQKYGLQLDATQLLAIVLPVVTKIAAHYAHQTITHAAAIKMGARLGLFLFAVLAASLLTPRSARAQATEMGPHPSVGPVGLVTYSLDGTKGDVAAGYQFGAAFWHPDFGAGQTYDVGAHAIVFGSFARAFGVGADLCINSTAYALGACGGLKIDLRDGNGNTWGNGLKLKTNVGLIAGIFGAFPDVHAILAAAAALKAKLGARAPIRCDDPINVDGPEGTHLFCR